MLGLVPLLSLFVPADWGDGLAASLAALLQAACTGALPVVAVKLLAHSGLRRQGLRFQGLTCACGVGAGVLLSLTGWARAHL